MLPGSYRTPIRTSDREGESVAADHGGEARRFVPAVAGLLLSGLGVMITSDDRRGSCLLASRRGVDFGRCRFPSKVYRHYVIIVHRPSQPIRME